MLDNNEVLVAWNQIKRMIDELELDIHKNAYGTVAAGLRIRRRLREFMKVVKRLRKSSIDLDRVNKEKSLKRRGPRKNSKKQVVEVVTTES